jgi:hypothetical protein
MYVVGLFASGGPYRSTYRHANIRDRRARAWCSDRACPSASRPDERPHEPLADNQDAHERASKYGGRTRFRPMRLRQKRQSLPHRLPQPKGRFLARSSFELRTLSNRDRRNSSSSVLESTRLDQRRSSITSKSCHDSHLLVQKHGRETNILCICRLCHRCTLKHRIPRLVRRRNRCVGLVLLLLYLRGRA